jgi:hypothetical protein
MQKHIRASFLFAHARRWPAFVHIALLSMCFAVIPAEAATFQGLYEATVRAADRSEKARDAAFAEALGVVAVRVTGMRDAPERLGGALGNARRYVQKFGYNADGTLQVGFDNVSVDQFLLQAGLPVWGKERPATLVLLPADVTGAPNVQEAIERAARARGIPLIWPSAGETGGQESEGSPITLAARYHADAVLIGRPSSSGALRWVLTFGGATTETQGALEDGVSFAADNYARVFATSPSAVSEVAMDVSGIDSLSAYAGALNYLEGLTLVRSAAVERVAGDSVRFRLVVRGDATTLRRAIALDHHLLAANSDSGTLSFRYQP